MSRTNPPVGSMHHTYPVPRTTQLPTDAKPKYGRLFFHVAVAGMMVRGFLGLNDLAAGKHIEYQVSGQGGDTTIHLDLPLRRRSERSELMDQFGGTSRRTRCVVSVMKATMRSVDHSQGFSST
jgi:hypothetical protein